MSLNKQPENSFDMSPAIFGFDLKRPRFTASLASRFLVDQDIVNSNVQRQGRIHQASSRACLPFISKWALSVPFNSEHIKRANDSSFRFLRLQPLWASSVKSYSSHSHSNPLYHLLGVGLLILKQETAQRSSVEKSSSSPYKKQRHNEDLKSAPVHTVHNDNHSRQSHGR